MMPRSHQRKLFLFDESPIVDDSPFTQHSPMNVKPGVAVPNS